MGSGGGARALTLRLQGEQSRISIFARASCHSSLRLVDTSHRLVPPLPVAVSSWLYLSSFGSCPFPSYRHLSLQASDCSPIERCRRETGDATR